MRCSPRASPDNIVDTSHNYSAFLVYMEIFLSCKTKEHIPKRGVQAHKRMNKGNRVLNIVGLEVPISEGIHPRFHSCTPGMGNQQSSRCFWAPSPVSPNQYGRMPGMMGVEVQQHMEGHKFLTPELVKHEMLSVNVKSRYMKAHVSFRYTNQIARIGCGFLLLYKL